MVSGLNLLILKEKTSVNRLLTLITSFTLFFNQTLWASAPQCELLFNKSRFSVSASDFKIISNYLKRDKINLVPNRIAIESADSADSVSVVHIKNEREVKDSKEDALELATYLLANPDTIIDGKDIFKKGEVILSFPVKGGYNIDVTYVNSNRSGKDNVANFLIDRIQVKSPTDITLIEFKKPDIYEIDRLEFSSKIAEFKLEKGNLKGLVINLDLPKSLPATITHENSMFNRIVKYFNLFPDKNELQKLLETKSPRYILTILKLKEQMAEFKETVLNPASRIGKLFLAALTGGVIAISVSATDKLGEKIKSAGAQVGIWEETTLPETIMNGIELPSNNAEVAKQFTELKKTAKQIFKDKKITATVPDVSELQLDYSNYFSRINKFWIVEKYDSSIKGNKTFAVLYVKHSKPNGHQTPDAFIIEIDPIKYAPLIQFVRAQGLVLTQK